MLDVLKGASDAEIKAAAKDQKLLAKLEAALSDAQMFEARKLLSIGDKKDDKVLDAVIERIKSANGYINDDEDAVWDALLDLTPEQRKTLWTDHNDVFSFMSSGAERKALEKMCTGSQADALKARMGLATEGMGTNDDAVSLVAQKTGESAQREAALQKELDRGTDQAGKPLTQERKIAIGRELQGLGGISENLLTGQDDGFDLKEGSFLQKLQGDVSDAEFQAFTKTMGVMPIERARRQILDAFGVFSDDEDKVYAAFDSLPEALRKELWKDPHVAARLSVRLDKAEHDKASDFAEGDSYTVAIRKIKDAFYGLNTEEVGVIKLISGLSEADRATFKSDPLWAEIRDSNWSFNGQEKSILKQLVETGKMPRGEALDYALGKNVKRTDRRSGAQYEVFEKGGGGSEMFEHWIGGLSAEARTQLRFGYWLARQPDGSAALKDGRAQGALAVYKDLEKRMGQRFGTDEVQKHIDSILGPPTPTDLGTPEGRAFASDILALRVKDKQGLQGSLGDAFTSSDETTDMAAVQFMAQYKALREDGEVSASDLAVLGHLAKQHGARYDDYVNTLDAVANIAGTVAAIAAGIVVTVLSGGSAGPLVGAALAKWAVAGAVAGAIAKVGTAEAIGGAHYEATGKEGMRDALSGAVDGAMAILGAGLAQRFTSMVGLGKAELSAEMAASVFQTTRGALSQTGKRIASGSIEAAVDGFLSGAVGEMVFKATDQETWNQGIWGAITDMGAALIKGGALGLGTGAVMGGSMDAVGSAFQTRRIRQVLGDLADDMPADRLSKLTIDQAEEIAKARKAVLKGASADDGRRAVSDLEGAIDTEDIDSVGQGLFGRKSQDAIEQSKKVIDQRDASLASSLERIPEGDPIFVDSVIVGSGWAGVADAKSHPLAGQVGDNGLPRVMGIAADSDPWAARLERMGQTPDELNVDGFGKQAADFSPSTEGFTPAKSFGAAVSENRADSGLAVWRKKIIGAQLAPEGSPGRIEITVDLGGGKTRKIYTNQFDLAMGPGPPRKIDAAVAPQQDQMIKQGTLIQGEAQLSQNFPDGEVLVYGGGATGAWNAELGTKQGAKVDWVGGSKQGGNRTKIAKIDADLRNPSLGDEAKVKLLGERAGLVESTDMGDVFAGSNVQRNQDILAQTEKTRRVADVLSIEPHVGEGGKNKALVTFADGTTREYDRVVMAIGQDAGAKGAIGAVADGMGLQLKPIIQNGKLLGVQSADGSVRILGAAATAKGSLLPHMAPDDRAVYLKLLKERVNSADVSTNSKGIEPAIEVWSDSIPKANQMDNAVPGAGGKTSAVAGEVAEEIDGAEALLRVGERLKSGVGLDHATVDKWIADHGLAKASEMMGDQLFDAAGMDLSQALKAMKDDPKAFYEAHGALMSGAVLRRALDAQEAGKAAMQAIGMKPGTNLAEFADGMGFSMMTHFTPEARAGQIVKSGSVIPGKKSGNLIWGTTSTTQAAPTRAQSYSFADYGRNAQEALPMAIPKEQLIPPTHAYETKSLPDWLNKKAYWVKGKLQSAIGEAAGMPPVALDGPIQLLPAGVGLTSKEVAGLQSKIAGTINTQGGEAAKITFVVVAMGGSGAYLVNYYYPDAFKFGGKKGQEDQGPDK